MNDLKNAKEKLIAGEYTCALCCGSQIFASTLRGVKPLVAWYKSGKDFGGYSAADKVVGKATAFLYVLLNVKAVFAKVISKSALDVLRESNIEVEYDQLVDNIINRQGDGICPFETAVLNIDNPLAAYNVIIKKMRELNIV